MDLLARRDHSEKELLEKLADRFPREEILEAVQFARDNRWMPDEKDLSLRVADSLHRRSKGIRSINQKLKEKGLPTVSGDPEVELEKALRLAQTKWSGEEPPDRATRERIGRFLLSRGFESGIVRKVIYEKL
ncbi:MAG: regulatory protein RecX [Bdellovibrionaceae bacterium]|nr:regulatory protein RecX [Pseudobdellovibrionaceae bacterium]MBX3032756.1 regulatory protein RecX [Pseudobdellovibrionaceae bacterium]